MRVSWWISKVTCTSLRARARAWMHRSPRECVIITVFPLQQWSRERASVVRCTSIACLVRFPCNFFTPVTLPPAGKPFYECICGFIANLSGTFQLLVVRTFIRLFHWVFIFYCFCSWGHFANSSKRTKEWSATFLLANSRLPWKPNQSSVPGFSFSLQIFCLSHYITDFKFLFISWLFAFFPHTFSLLRYLFLRY